MLNECKGKLLPNGLNYFPLREGVFLNLLVLISKVMPSKFFSLASSLCGRKLNVSFSDSFITHSSADVLHKAF